MVIISAVSVTMNASYHRHWKEGTMLELASSFLSASTIAWLCHSVSLCSPTKTDESIFAVAVRIFKFFVIPFGAHQTPLPVSDTSVS